MKKKAMTAIVAGLILMAVTSVPVLAAFHSDTEKAYNDAVNSQAALDGLDVEVTEKTVSAATNLQSVKQVQLKVSGLQGKQLLADIVVTADETSEESFYRDGYYYETVGEKKLRREMDRDEMWEQINSLIYLDMTSDYLNMLYSEELADGSTQFHFSATGETLDEYAKKLLDTYSVEQGVEIDSLQGEMTVSTDGHVDTRKITLVYTIQNGDQAESFMKTADSRFLENGAVAVSIPDLSGYEEVQEEKPAATLTSLQRTIYVTDDVNVRAAGNLNAAIIGGFPAGSGVTQTGYTSDGWIQVLYGGATGYIWGEYISTTKPVITTGSSGVMYATVDVNIRQSFNTDATILGILRQGSSIEITGQTNNGWIRVKYNGTTGYIRSDYLTWSEPVVSTYVTNGRMTGTVIDASYGSLTIRDDRTGETVMFNTTYAVMNLIDTIDTGDPVSVIYEGAGSPYTADSVTDSIRHDD